MTRRRAVGLAWVAAYIVGTAIPFGAALVGVLAAFTTYRRSDTSTRIWLVVLGIALSLFKLSGWIVLHHGLSQHTTGFSTGG